MQLPGDLYLTLMRITVLIAAVPGARAALGFYPSIVFLSGPEATSFLVSPSPVTLSLAVVTSLTSLPAQSCNGNNSTEDWSLVLNGMMQSNVSKVTVTLKKNLTLCSVNETNCCADVLCVVETLQVTACQNNQYFASLLIHAEIYVNTTFVGTVSDNKTIIPNQVYQPLGSCPCNLTAGACDILCCCDQECSPSMRELFNGSCYSGIFGGNVRPPFDHLCSVQEKSHAPDWFPFLCVQSSMDNSPFLGYFYQGYTEPPSQTPSFNLYFQSIDEKTTSGYRQGSAIFIDQNGFNEYLMIPQPSTTGACASYAPVAYLQNFNATCVTDITSCSDILRLDFNVMVRDGNEGKIPLVVKKHNITMDITTTGPALSQPLQCDIIMFADYAFIWKANKIQEIQVDVVTANISLTHQAKISQRFTATFLTSNNTLEVLSGNPGYQVGMPIIAANGSVPFVKSNLNIWKPVGDGSCADVTQTPVLFGQNSFSGCLFTVVNENCNQLRERVSLFLKSKVSAEYVAMRGNSNSSNLSEWVSIIQEEPNTTCSGDCATENVTCLKVPVNMNIQIITAVTGAVEGINQEEILAVKVSFSTSNVDCVSVCNQSFPITTSVQFIEVPAQPPPHITRFQMTYTEYDCEKNDVCWQQLAYPLTSYYTGEPRHLTLAKGMILIFFFISAAVLGGPWNIIQRAWNNTTF